MVKSKEREEREAILSPPWVSEDFLSKIILKSVTSMQHSLLVFFTWVFYLRICNLPHHTPHTHLSAGLAFCCPSFLSCRDSVTLSSSSESWLSVLWERSLFSSAFLACGGNENHKNMSELKVAPNSLILKSWPGKQPDHTQCTWWLTHQCHLHVYQFQKKLCSQEILLYSSLECHLTRLMFRNFCQDLLHESCTMHTVVLIQCINVRLMWICWMP